MKPKSSGPKNPKPNGPAPSLKALNQNNLSDGVKYAAGPAAVIGGFVANALGKDKIQRLDAKGSRQESRAGKKEVRANRIEENRPAKAAKLREKAAELNTRGSQNKKEAERLYNLKNKKR